jgi:amino acid transporter
VTQRNLRDTGLLRTVGAWTLAASIVNIIVGAGIFEVPSSLAAAVGPYAPFAFAACALAIGAIAICFAEGGSRVATSGGAYGYIAAAFGPLSGFMAAILLVFSDVLACGGIAAALGDAIASLAPAERQAVVRIAVITAIIAGLALMNILGVSGAARLSNVATIVKLLPLVIFIAVGAGAAHAGNFSLHGLPSDHGIGHGLILALFAFTGMEGALSASGEVRNPSRTIPRALLIAMPAVTLLYMGIQTVAQGILGPALASSTVPLADAMARINPTLRLLMLAGAAFSMFGWLCSDILCSPRILFALGRDGLFPQALGRLHAERHTPYAAILCYAAVALTLALTGTFSELAVLSALAVVPLYMGGCAAAWHLSRRQIALDGPPLRFRWLGAAAVIGIVSMGCLLALGSRAEITGLAVLLAGSALIYAVQTRTWLRRDLA